ncbi:MAG: transposase [Bacteroidota bacterium]
MKHKSFSKEVKLSVVRDVQSGKSLAEICREYVTDANTVRRWKREYDKNPSAAFTGKGVASTLEAKYAKAERMIGQQSLEIDFLKKALERLERLQAEQRLARSSK